MAKKAKGAAGERATKKAMRRRAPPTRGKAGGKAITKKTAQKSPATGKPLATILDYVRFAANRLTKAKVVFAHGTTDPVAEAAFLVGETLGVHPDAVENAAGRRVAKADGVRIMDIVEQRIRSRKPAAYLLKKIYMRGLPFYVDERTIVPRSFIGEILEAQFGDDGLQLCDPAKVSRALDLCTGSGCLAILAARAFPNAAIDASDLSSGALEVAHRNIADFGLEKRIRLKQGNLFASLGGERYDLIIANPPYVDAEGMAGLPPECQYEPRIAFDGGADGIDLVRHILDSARAHLNEGGGLLCEVGRCRPALEAAYPRTPFLWIETEESVDEVFWLEARDL